MTQGLEEIIAWIENDLAEDMDFNMNKAELVQGYVKMLKKAVKRGRTVYVLTQIDKTNYPCTEPQDIRNWVFVSTKAARSKMKELFDKTPDQETNELRYWDAFKNSNDYEILWTIKRAKIDEG